jgi:predicted transcriptional regulator
MEQATQFKNNYEKIVNPEYWDDIKKNYEMIENNIKNFKFNPNNKSRKTNNKQLDVNKNLTPTGQIDSINLKIDINNKNYLLKPLDFKQFQNIEYGYGEAWKKYLSHITKLLSEGKEVQTKNLAESVGVNTRNTRKNIQKLITKGLISINGEHNNRTIILTEKGRTELKIN